jgi:hypothetical protein
MLHPGILPSSGTILARELNLMYIEVTRYVELRRAVANIVFSSDQYIPVMADRLLAF